MRLWDDTADGPRPVATSCRNCGRRCFPVSDLCRFCGASAVDHVRLSAKAKLLAWSVMDHGVVIHVETDEGVLLLACTDPGKSFSAGMSMQFEPRNGLMRYIAHE